MKTTHKPLLLGPGRLMLLAALWLGLLASACSTNDAATKKCRKAKDCATCCKDNGATGHASGTVNGDYSCKCLGG